MEEKDGLKSCNYSATARYNAVATDTTSAQYRAYTYLYTSGLHRKIVVETGYADHPLCDTIEKQKILFS